MNKAHNPINWVNSPETDTPLNAENLNKMDITIGIIDDRVVSLDATKATKAEVANVVTDVHLDLSTGIFTITHKNGSTEKYNSNLEKLAVNFSYDKTNQQLVIALDDGTIQYVDLKALITELEFLDSNTVLFSVSSDGRVSANIAKGSITDEMIEANYLSKVQLHASNAIVSANNAKASEENASTSEENARGYMEETKQLASQTQGVIEEVNKKLELATFELDDDGNLIYTDTSSYDFLVDDDGMLNYSVSE